MSYTKYNTQLAPIIRIADHLVCDIATPEKATQLIESGSKISSVVANLSDDLKIAMVSDFKADAELCNSVECIVSSASNTILACSLGVSFIQILGQVVRIWTFQEMLNQAQSLVTMSAESRLHIKQKLIEVVKNCANAADIFPKHFDNSMTTEDVFLLKEEFDEKINMAKDLVTQILNEIGKFLRHFLSFSPQFI